MITILSFVAKKGNEFMKSEVYYDLITKECIYLCIWSINGKIEQNKYKNIVIPTANYQADLKYAIKHGYKVTIL